MKILSNRAYNKLIDSAAEAYRKGYDTGRMIGRDMGFKQGMTADKKGVFIDSTGIYVFEDALLTKAGTGVKRHGD